MTFTGEQPGAVYRRLETDLGLAYDELRVMVRDDSEPQPRPIGPGSRVSGLEAADMALERAIATLEGFGRRLRAWGDAAEQDWLEQHGSLEQWIKEHGEPQDVGGSQTKA
jgi:hypothetical protein